MSIQVMGVVGLYIIRKKDVKKDAKDAIEKRCKRKKTQKKNKRERIRKRCERKKMSKKKREVNDFSFSFTKVGMMRKARTMRPVYIMPV